MVVTMQPVHISLVRNKREREKALSFLQGMIKKWYNCAPLYLPKLVIVAKRGSEIVGTSGIEFIDGRKKFSLEVIYEFDWEKTSFPYPRSLFVECGRWAATIPDISGALLYASAVYALKHGKIYGIGEAKGRVVTRFKELGLDLHFLDAKLLLEKISPASRNYYVVEPIPQVCMFSVEQEEAALRIGADRAISEGNVVFAPSLLKP